MIGDFAIFCAAVLADRLMGAVRLAAVAVLRLAVAFVAGAGMRVRAVSVGRPCTPVMAKRIAVRKGRFRLRPLGACAAVHTGGIVDRCVRAACGGLQIGFLGRFGGILMRRHFAVRSAAVLADCLMRAVRLAAVAILCLAVAFVAGTGMRVRAVSVGRPCAPVMAERSAMRKGRFRLRPPGACAAAGAGGIVDRRIRAACRCLQVGRVGVLRSVAVRCKAAVGLAADAAHRLRGAGRRAAGAGLIYRRQRGVGVGHRAGVGRACADARGAAAHGQLPMGEMLPGGRVLGGIGDRIAARDAGRASLPDVDQRQGIVLRLGKADIFVS